ncbi:MAG TPA: MFS transporter [Terracidiphilus sp.]|nr:MFS transporter [Terracidiphilus sp.]
MNSTPMKPVYAKIMRRIVPFLMLLYTVAFLDRVNIGFAALTMNRDLGISDRVYGFAAGVFFLTYCLFQVPANMALTRIGARRWLAALMVVWGIVSMATALVASAPAYIGLRALLGIAESGFYPGVIYYFTFWLPRALRTRALALFLLALPLCNVVGSPVSAHILLMEQVAGMHGWQWLFFLEGAPAVLLGIATWFLLADHPQSALWLSQEEKAEVERDLADDDAVQKAGASNLWLKITADSVAYFLWSTGIYGLSFWLPKILVARGATTLATGWWATLTFAAGAVALMWASRQRNMRPLPLLFFAAGAGFAVCGLSHTVGEAVAGFCLACMGLLSSLPMFWSVCTGRLSGKAAGAAIAIVNSWGAVGAFAGPYAMGWLHDATQHYTAGLWAIAACLGCGAIVVQASREVRPA